MPVVVLPVSGKRRLPLPGMVGGGPAGVVVAVAFAALVALGAAVGGGAAPDPTKRFSTPSLYPPPCMYHSAPSGPVAMSIIEAGSPSIEFAALTAVRSAFREK